VDGRTPLHERQLPAQASRQPAPRSSRTLRRWYRSPWRADHQRNRWSVASRTKNRQTLDGHGSLWHPRPGCGRLTWRSADLRANQSAARLGPAMAIRIHAPVSRPPLFSLGLPSSRRRSVRRRARLVLPALLALVSVPVPDGAWLGAALAPRRPRGELEAAQLAT
jgi:hypothetical protein